MQRHLGHYREKEPEGDAGPSLPPGKRAGDLEILDQIIQRGFENSRAWRPTIKDTIEAMKLKMQMTGNSAFDDMLRAMERGLSLAEGIEDPEDVLPENPEALASEDERSSDEDVLPDPVV